MRGRPFAWRTVVAAATVIALAARAAFAAVLAIRTLAALALAILARNPIVARLPVAMPGLFAAVTPPSVTALARLRLANGRRCLGA
jgi:hypothetical protein